MTINVTREAVCLADQPVHVRRGVEARPDMGLDGVKDVAGRVIHRIEAETKGSLHGIEGVHRHRRIERCGAFERCSQILDKPGRPVLLRRG